MKRLAATVIASLLATSAVAQSGPASNFFSGSPVTVWDPASGRACSTVNPCSGIFGAGGSGGGGGAGVIGTQAAPDIVGGSGAGPLDTGAGASTANTLRVLFGTGQTVGVTNTGFNALQGGAANAAGNPFYVTPGTGALFSEAGSAGSAVGQGATGTAANSQTVQGVAGGALLSVQQPDVVQSGTLPAQTVNATYLAPLANGEGTLGINLVGLTASGATLVVETQDGATAPWSTLNALGSGGVLFSTLTVDGGYKVNASAHYAIRLRVSVAGSASTINVYSIASTTNGVTALIGPLPPGANPIGTVLPLRAATVTSNGTIATAGTFQVALAASTARLGCNVFPTTSGGTITVSLGLGPTAATAQAITYPGVFNCATPAGVVVSDQINVTSSTVNTAFGINAQ